MQADSYCHRCGVALDDQEDYPKQCARCGNVIYRNPLPVTVVLQPVGDGLLVVKRGLPKGYGRLALPGGYVEVGETWQQAAVRELQEETGIVQAAQAVRHFWTASNDTGSYLLIFGVVPPLAQLADFTANDETLAVSVIERPQPLAFELHSAAVGRYFEQYD